MSNEQFFILNFIGMLINWHRRPDVTSFLPYVAFKRVLISSFVQERLSSHEIKSWSERILNLSTKKDKTNANRSLFIVLTKQNSSRYLPSSLAHHKINLHFIGSFMRASILINVEKISNALSSTRWCFFLLR